MNLSDLSDLQVVARTIWGESRSEGEQGMHAVGSVIQNRVRIGGWWGDQPRTVCLKPFQFSCWNRNDPNLPKLLNLDETDPQYVTSEGLAKVILTGDLGDIVSGADSYETKDTNAFWARNLTPVVTIGNHNFYITVGIT